MISRARSWTLPAALLACCLVVSFLAVSTATRAADAPAQSKPHRASRTQHPADLQNASLDTVAEQSGFARTGHYEEVERLCAAYARTWRDAVRCVDFGHTPEGRPMLALVVSRSGALAAQDAHTRNVPVMLMQGGIHAGEIDGKDAGFLAVRELLRDTAAPGALKSFVLLFVPVFNVDGHERFGRWNRPNQTGPEEMGWRTTAQNYNLNRDYTKADAPEMQAMLRLLNIWDPVLYVDMHVTDGAEFQHDVSNTLEPVYGGDPELHPTGQALVAELNAKLTLAGSLPLDFYPSFVADDDPASGFAVGAAPARFSTGYWALHNRFALLVETHSWKDYRTRVRITHDIIVTLSQMMARDGLKWRAQMQDADARAQSLGGQDVAIEYENGPHTTPIEFRGYAYTRELSAISGALVTHYDPTKPEIWQVPLRDTVVAKRTVQAPRAGYVVPMAYASWVAEKLSLHGVHFERLAKAVDGAKAEVFRATKVTYSKAPFEGHTLMTFEGKWQPEQRALAAGSLFVPITQSNARVLITLLEPQDPDSFAAWGLFNTAFEAKEYMEPYVAEQVAQDMMAHDPAVAQAFRRKVGEDQEFAANPTARLEFFYRRHPSWDERLNLYPVLRVDSAP